MAECIECGEYTKFEGGLCYPCYKNQNISKTQEEKDDSRKKRIE